MTVAALPKPVGPTLDPVVPLAKLPERTNQDGGTDQVFRNPVKLVPR